MAGITISAVKLFFSKLKKTYSQISRRSGGCAYIPHGCTGSSERPDCIKDREKKKFK